MCKYLCILEYLFACINMWRCVRAYQLLISVKSVECVLYRCTWLRRRKLTNACGYYEICDLIRLSFDEIDTPKCFFNYIELGLRNVPVETTKRLIPFQKHVCNLTRLSNLSVRNKILFWYYKSILCRCRYLLTFKIIIDENLYRKGNIKNSFLFLWLILLDTWGLQGCANIFTVARSNLKLTAGESLYLKFRNDTLSFKLFNTVCSIHNNWLFTECVVTISIKSFCAKLMGHNVLTQLNLFT